MRKSLLSLALLSVTITAQAQYRLNDLVFEWYDITTQNYTQADSQHYYYSGVRGGYLPNHYYYHRIPETPITPLYAWPIQFDRAFASNTAYNEMILCDSVELYRRHTAPNSIYVKIVQGLNGNMISTWQKYIRSGQWQGTLQINAQRTNRYTAGRLSNRVMSGSDSTVYFYTAQNHLDSTVSVYSNSVNTQVLSVKYNYGSNNELLNREVYSSVNASPFVFSYREQFTYGQNGLPDQYFRIYSPSAGVDTLESVVFSYNNNNQLIEEQYYAKYSSAPMYHYSTVKIANNSSGNRIADTTYYTYSQNVALAKRALRTYGYNANGHINQYELQYWDSTNKVWGADLDSLYGPAMRVNAKYTGTLSVGETVAAESNDVQLYPIPAHNLITIKATMPDDNPFEVLVYDMQGVVIKRWQEQGVVNYTRTIPTDDIPTGTYILSLSGSDVHMTKRMVIVK